MNTMYNVTFFINATKNGLVAGNITINKSFFTKEEKDLECVHFSTDKRMYESYVLCENIEDAFKVGQTIQMQTLNQLTQK